MPTFLGRLGGASGRGGGPPTQGGAYIWGWRPPNGAASGVAGPARPTRVPPPFGLCPWRGLCGLPCGLGEAAPPGGPWGRPLLSSLGPRSTLFYCVGAGSEASSPSSSLWRSPGWA